MNEINFEIKDVEKIDLSMDVGVKEIFPPIENLEVTPTKEQQVFTHENSYGYDNVTVNAIPDEYIIPDGTLPITENTTYDVRRYARVSASVHPAPYLQDKEVTITENGTQSITFDEGYDGLNSVEVTTNIESSGVEPITSLSLCGERMMNDMKEFLTYLKTVPETYDTYTDEPVTLYSPAAGYNNYAIRYRGSSGGKYCVVWFKDDVVSLKYGDSSNFYSNNIATRNVYSDNINILNPSDMLLVNTKSTVAYMYSSYASLSQCIEAMKSPTTSYTTSSSGSSWGYVSDSSGYMLPVTNMPCFKDNELQKGRRISKNETIVVMS